MEVGVRRGAHFQLNERKLMLSLASMATLPAMPISEKPRSRLSISRRDEPLTRCLRARCNRGSAVRNCLAVVLAAVSDRGYGLEALTLKRERSIHLRWHHKIPRTRHGNEAQRERS
jgi:hypothetical protein